MIKTQAVIKHKDITDKILQVFFKIVYPQLGYGFLKKVYENAMLISLQDLGLEVRSQAKIDVHFHGHVVGEYFADLLVEKSVIVELKALAQLTNEHEAQLLNYLRATPYELGFCSTLALNPTSVAKYSTIVAKQSPGL